MTTPQENLDSLLLSAKQLVAASEHLLEVNHHKLRFGNYEFTTAVFNTNKLIKQIEQTQCNKT